MKNIISATKARQKFFDLIQKVDATGTHYVITVDGQPKAVVMDPDEYEGWQETLEVMSDPETVKAIEQGKRDIRAGRTKTFKEVFGMTEQEALKIAKS